MYFHNIHPLDYSSRQIPDYGAELKDLKYGSTAEQFKWSRRLHCELKGFGRRFDHKQDSGYGSGGRKRGHATIICIFT
jgi:hypothetical protein